MRKYADAKEKELDRCLQYYKEAINTKFFNENYITLNNKYM